MFASISSPLWPISTDPKAFDPKGAFMKFIKYMTGFSKKEKIKWLVSGKVEVTTTRRWANRLVKTDRTILLFPHQEQGIQLTD